MPCRNIWAGSRALSLLLPVVSPDVRPVEHILSPYVGFHDEGTAYGDKQEKQSHVDNHFEPPAMRGSYRFWKNFGQRRPLINRSDKKNDDCGICAATYQRLPRRETETRGDRKHPLMISPKNFLALKQ
jgi:hypothetical protein